MNTAVAGIARRTHTGVLIVFVASLLAMVCIHFGTAQSIVSIWSRSDTYAHGFIIVPVSLWLIWRKRDVLSGLPVKLWWPATVVLAALGAVWLLGELAAVQVVRQYAFVAMIPATVLAILGPAVTTAIAFPLAFLLLGVPFGESFIDPLVKFTADFTIGALQLVGIPVLRNGNSFDIPSGSWSVVEACSGVRYLISSVTLGCLYAYLSYRALWKRIAFVLLSIVVPVIANGIRAWLIVLIGHYSGNKLAAGVDHLVYGWVFFGMVMFAMFWAGSFWNEEIAPASQAPGRLSRAIGAETPAQFFQAAAFAVAIVAAWPMYANMIERSLGHPDTLRITQYAASWNRVPAFVDWAPAYQRPAVEHRGYYAREGKPVGLMVMAYGMDAQKAQLITSSNRLLQNEDARWKLLEERVQREHIAGREIAVHEAIIHDGHRSLLVWHTYWVDGSFTSNDYVGKLLQARQKLLMRSGGNAAVFLFAPLTENNEDCRAILRRFLAENLGTLEAALLGEGRH
jgi:exosortase A